MAAQRRAWNLSQRTNGVSDESAELEQQILARLHQASRLSMPLNSRFEPRAHRAASVDDAARWRAAVFAEDNEPFIRLPWRPARVGWSIPRMVWELQQWAGRLPPRRQRIARFVWRRVLPLRRIAGRMLRSSPHARRRAGIGGGVAAVLVTLGVLTRHRSVRSRSSSPGRR